MSNCGRCMGKGQIDVSGSTGNVTSYYKIPCPQCSGCSGCRRLQAQLADRHQRMEDRMYERDTERHETDLRILALEAQVKENQKELLVFAASAAKAQQGLYEDEEFPFTKAELRTKLSFAASFISGLATALRHTAIKGEG